MWYSVPRYTFLKNTHTPILSEPIIKFQNKSPPIDTEKREDGKYLVFVSNCSIDCVIGAVKLCELYNNMSFVYFATSSVNFLT